MRRIKAGLLWLLSAAGVGAAERLVQEAEALLAAEQPAAVVLMLQVLAPEPSDLAGLLLTRAGIRSGRDEYQQAVLAAATAPSALPADLQGAWWQNRAEAAGRQQQARLAVTAAGEALRRGGRLVEGDRLLLLLAEALVQLDESELAARAAWRLWRGWPQSPYRWQAGLLWASLQARERPVQAREVLTSIRIADAAPSELQRQASLRNAALLASARPDDALAVLAEARQRWPEDVELRRLQETLAAPTAAGETTPSTAAGAEPPAQGLAWALRAPLTAAAAESPQATGPAALVLAARLQQAGQVSVAQQVLTREADAATLGAAAAQAELHPVLGHLQEKAAAELVAALQAALRAAPVASQERGEAWIALGEQRYAQRQVAAAVEAWQRGLADLPSAHPWFGPTATRVAQVLLEPLPAGSVGRPPSARQQQLIDAALALQTAAAGEPAEARASLWFLALQAYAQAGEVAEAQRLLAALAASADAAQQERLRAISQRLQAGRP